MLSIYGQEKKMIGITEPLSNECPYCETANTTALTVYSKYYHVLSVPVLPFKKQAAAECTNCKAIRWDIQLSPDLIQQAHKVQKAVRHPFHLYLFTVLLCLLVLTVVVLMFAVLVKA